MNKLIPFLVFFAMTMAAFPLNAQKTYKAVCDKRDGTVKIVDSEDRSPDLVPLKGGFPFYQVAQNWVKENFPNGKCDPAAAQKQATTAAAVNPTAQTSTQATTVQQQPASNQTRPASQPGTFAGAAPGQTPARIPSIIYRNTSIVLSVGISDFGRAYNLDPPVVPGLNIGIDHVFGKRVYFGTGLHFNTLLGLDNSSDETSSFYFLKVPLFAGFRQVTGKRYWGADLGVAANTMLKPLTADSNLGSETASDLSLNTLVRARFGNERSAFEFGFNFWLNDILVTWEGYRMKAFSIGYRYSF